MARMRRATRAATQTRPGAWEQPNAARTTDQATYGLTSQFRQDTSATVASGRASPRRSAVLPTSPVAPGRSRVAERAEGHAGGRPDVPRCATRPRRTTVRTRHRVRAEHRASPARSAPQLGAASPPRATTTSVAAASRTSTVPRSASRVVGPRTRSRSAATTGSSSAPYPGCCGSHVSDCARPHSHCAPAAHLGLGTDCLASTRAARVVRPGLSTSPRAVACASCHGPRPTA